MVFALTPSRIDPSTQSLGQQQHALYVAIVLLETQSPQRSATSVTSRVTARVKGSSRIGTFPTPASFDARVAMQLIHSKRSGIKCMSSQMHTTAPTRAVGHQSLRGHPRAPMQLLVPFRIQHLLYSPRL